MSIVYKVVDEKTRHGSNFALYATNPSHTYKEAREKIKLYKLNKYFPIYKKGKIIKAAKDSVGIFCFNKKKSAKDFVYSNDILHCSVIIKVRSIGKSRKIDRISSSCGSSFRNIILEPDSIPLLGTVFYNSVEVLE